MAVAHLIHGGLLRVSVHGLLLHGRHGLHLSCARGDTQARVSQIACRRQGSRHSSPGLGASAARHATCLGSRGGGATGARRR